MPAGILCTRGCVVVTAANYFFSKFYYTQGGEKLVKKSTYNGFYKAGGL